jgi:hypothetical protein
MNKDRPLSLCDDFNSGLCDDLNWCICEAVETIQTHIEVDIVDLSEEDKKKYFDRLQQKIKAIK